MKDPKDLFATMCLIREVESRLLEMFSRGLLRGTVHTCIGQEACAVGVVSALDRSRDIVYSNHRGHGHYLAFTSDAAGLVAEVMGRTDGLCGGIGGSQHLQSGNFYSNGILGAGLPVAVGMALAEKRKRTAAVCVAFVGDGTFGEGVVYEAMNMAAVWQVPLLLVVEDNHYAQTTPARIQHAGDLSARAVPFGIPVTKEDGMDVVRVHSAALRLVRELREFGRPQLLYLDTYRFAPHSKGDDFREPGEIAQAKKRDPLLVARDYLEETVCRRLEQEAKAEISGLIESLLIGKER